MSLFQILLLCVAVPYFCWLTYRVLKMVWDQGALGEVVTGGDVVDMMGRDLWKLVTLPAVMVKAARKT